MSLELSIVKLADAMIALTATISRLDHTTRADTGDKPSLIKTPQQRAAEKPAEEAAERAAEKAALKAAEKAALKAAEKPAEKSVHEPAAPAAPAAPAVPGHKTIAKADVQKKLIEVVVKVGKPACSALCMAHGGPNLSALDPAVYEALLTDAQAVLDAAANG